MEKILITGATGFIGSHLTELCVEKGYEVVAFDRYNPNRNLGWLEKSKYQKDINFIFILFIIRKYDYFLEMLSSKERFPHRHLLPLNDQHHQFRELQPPEKTHAIYPKITC